MSLLSSLNNVVKATVRIAAGSEAANVYGTVASSFGAATLETVVVAGQFTNGAVSTVAAAIPATANLIKGAGLGLLESTSLDEFSDKWNHFSKEEKAEAIQQLGAKGISSLIQALREEEAK